MTLWLVHRLEASIPASHTIRLFIQFPAWRLKFNVDLELAASPQHGCYIAMSYAKSFDPIESDPQVLTTLMHHLGVQENFYFEDVLDYKDESQQPALALIVIFRESQSDEVEKATIEATRTPTTTDSVTFVKQTIDNSCGLVAILHCVLNTIAAKTLSKSPDQWLV